jgi:hypothetical protein
MRTESVDGYVMSTWNKRHECLYRFGPLENTNLTSSSWWCCIACAREPKQRCDDLRKMSKAALYSLTD